MGISGIVAGQDAMRLYGQLVPFSVTYSTGNWGQVNAAHSAWNMNGGAFPTLDGAPRICTSATTGALPIQAPDAGKSLYVVGFDIVVPTTSAALTVILYDRICDIQATEGAAPFSGGALDATSKLNTGESCVAFQEVSATTSTSIYTTQWNYTNQAGTSHNSSFSPFTSTGNIGLVGQLVSYFDGVSANVNPTWAPLAGGDQGMRTVTSITLPSGSVVGPGAYTYVLARPLVTINVPTLGFGESADLLAQTATPMRIRDDACLSFLVLPTSTTPDGIWFGRVRLLSA